MDYFNPAFLALLHSGAISLDFAYDDFTSYGDQGAVDAVYVPNDSAQMRGDITNDRLNYNAIADSTNDSIARALGGNASDTAWILRLRYKMTAQSKNGSGYEMFPVIGLSSLSQASAESANQDSISFSAYQDNLTRPYHHNASDSARMFGATNVTFSETATVNDDYRLELKRLSATSSNAQLFSDAYSTSVESKGLTIPSTVLSLAYFVVRNGSPTPNQSGSQTGWLDDIGFQNGVTTWV